jgi:hypothetical protein
MIRVVMLGRLGNNLFQYAFGRALAERHGGAPLELNASWFNHRTWPYVAPLARLPGFRSGKARLTRRASFGARALKKLNGRHYWEYLGKPILREREMNHSFDATLLDAPSDCVVFGYFQSPRYFQSIEPQLREELSLDALGLETGHAALVQELCKPHAVAVHVRRTDYVGNPNLVSLGTEYYHDAMEWMRKRVDRPVFHLFSDDPVWCRETFHADDIRIVTHSDPFRPLEDLYLMQLAAHHIIANSSYSWWAAWLGKKTGQQVLMPDRWFHSGIVSPIEDRMMPGWTCLPAR